jgi:hypothetical protein
MKQAARFIQFLHRLYMPANDYDTLVSVSGMYEMNNSKEGAKLAPLLNAGRIYATLKSGPNCSGSSKTKVCDTGS